MTTQTLTTYYCAICDKIANLFTKIISETKFDPKFDHSFTPIIKKGLTKRSSLVLYSVLN